MRFDRAFTVRAAFTLCVVFALCVAASVVAAPRSSTGAGPHLSALQAPVKVPQASTELSVRAATSADFDGDGLPDVAAGFATGNGGLIRLYLGAGSASKPFRSTARAIPLSDRPDLLASGDFDADGRADLVFATQGGRTLCFLIGDVGGRFTSPQCAEQHGAITALVAGEVNRADGLPDVVLGLEDGSGASLAIYESPRGAARAEPAVVPLPFPARSLMLGELGEGYPMDIAAASGSGVVVVWGMDRRLARGGPPVSWIPAVSRLSPTEFVSLSHASSVIPRLEATTPGRETTDMRLEAVPEGLETPVSERGSRFALPIRLNSDGLADLVIFHDGSAVPQVLLTRPLVVYTVNSAADTDDGVCDATDCSLREAVNAANASAGADSIAFALGAGTPVIALESPLPVITDAVTIAGDTGGAVRVEINGAGAGPGANGVTLSAGSDGSVVRALVVDEFEGTGVRVESSWNVVEASYIGTGAAGTSSVGPNNGGGILLTGAGAMHNVIGGVTSSARNVISNNALFGVRLDAGASENQVQGNFIGPDATGSEPAANVADGVSILGGAQNNTIGGPTNAPGEAPGNVISANQGDGLDISGSGTDGNLVSGNLIGTAASGTTALPNSQEGVILQSGASGNTIGGTSNAQRNVISAGPSVVSDGVEINGPGTDRNHVFGNFIGTDISGAAALPNMEHGVLVQGNARDNLIGAATPTPGQTGGNVISGNVSDGVRFTGVDSWGNSIQGNLIGLRASGDAAVANGGSGVTLTSVWYCTVGGEEVENRNVISGSLGHGVDLVSYSWHNFIGGNYIGVDVTGQAAVPNGGNGVRIHGTGSGVAYNAIGEEASVPGTPPGNVISGNALNGVQVSGDGPINNELYGNIIGLDASGERAVPNGRNGVLLTNSPGYTEVGGGPGEGNVISGNDSNSDADGVEMNGMSFTRVNIVAGNLIGTNLAGTVAIPNGGNGVLITGNAFDNAVGTSPAYPDAAGNVISGNASDGIEINGTRVTRNTYSGNLIGLSADGTTALANHNNGILITNGATSNVIGGSPFVRNVVSGNDLTGSSDGIEINGSSGNTVTGNFIGTTPDGSGAIGNGGAGVFITQGPLGQAATNNIVNGKNVISANHGSGITISGANARDNLVKGNLIGLTSNGSFGLGNVGYGVLVKSASMGNTIGGANVTPGPCSGDCNRIGSNGLGGAAIDTFASTSNLIRGNSIARNSGPAIDLLPAGPTSNDPQDLDFGPNRLQNYPVIAAAMYNGSATTVEGVLDSAPDTSYVVEVFSSPSGSNLSGAGDGEIFVSSTTCTTDSGGHGSWTVSVGGLPSYFSSTATDPNKNTSEISIAVAPDSDGDGAPDPADCAPSNPTVFAVPSEVSNQRFSPDKTTQTWDSAAPGAGTGTVHAMVRGVIGQWPVGSGAAESCIEPGTTAPAATDATVPLTGSGFYYIVRARNACGTGPYGTTSGGAPRITSACP